MFSIIVPVHNAENTIRRCLDSLLAQTYASFEVLLIENGSSDQSKGICEEYQRRDDRFRTFSIPACKGPSKPRNTGLDYATGEYVAFVDADDWVEPDFLQELSVGLCAYDVVFLGYQKENPEGDYRGENLPHLQTKRSREAALQLVAQDNFGYTWCKALRRSTIGTVRFDETLNLFEDERFILQVLEKTAEIEAISKPLYHYVCENTTSLMGRKHEDMIEKKDVIFREWCHFLGDEGHPDAVSIANVFLKFCVLYAWENHYNLRSAYQRIQATTFYTQACEAPTYTTKVIQLGFWRFLCERWYLATKQYLYQRIKGK